MSDEPSWMALAVNRVIADFDSGFKERTKPLALNFISIEGIWVPILVCVYCRKGPITSLDDDSCCESSLTSQWPEVCQWLSAGGPQRSCVLIKGHDGDHKDIEGIEFTVYFNS
jgi:hypothetical protein